MWSQKPGCRFMNECCTRQHPYNTADIYRLFDAKSIRELFYCHICIWKATKNTLFFGLRQLFKELTGKSASWRQTSPRYVFWSASGLWSLPSIIPFWSILLSWALQKTWNVRLLDVLQSSSHYLFQRTLYLWEEGQPRQNPTLLFRAKLNLQGWMHRWLVVESLSENKLDIIWQIEI